MIPKFRVFVKSGTKQMYGGVYEKDAMVPVGVLDITGEEVTVWGCGRENCGMCDDYFRMKDIILMQSTGLEDKNGVEIYVGDIVHIFIEEEYQAINMLDIVVFENGSFATQSFAYDFYNNGGDLLTVKGNIYEHPELLEEVPND